MKIIRHPDGIDHNHENRALQKIEEMFKNSIGHKSSSAKSGSIQDQLASTLGVNPMFPWRGYSGFRFKEDGPPGEIDLLMVTHRHIIIVELKHYAKGEIYEAKGNWYSGNKHLGKSPVAITERKTHLIRKKLNKINRNEFTSKDYPYVDFLIVMTGEANFNKLGADAKKWIITLKDFSELSKESTYDKRFMRKNKPEASMLNQDFDLFDKLFTNNNNIAPKVVRFNGHRPDKEIFKHPLNVYKEFITEPESSASDPALLRKWNFENMEGTQSQSPDGRLEIISKEPGILLHIKRQDGGLYSNCLRSLTTPPQKNEITAEYYELYELPSQHETFNQYIGTYGKTLGEVEKLNLVKILISRFSDLHSINLAHLDIGAHSLWLSTKTYGVALSNFISATHKPDGEIGYYKNPIAVNELALNSSPKNQGSSTAFEEDVRTLAVVSWHIFNGERLSENTVSSLYTNVTASRAWYAPILINALDGGKYRSASDFFDAIESLQPSNEKAYEFDHTDLEKYRKNISHSREYRDDEFFVDTDGKEVYLSGEQVVTAWNEIGFSEVGLGYKVLNFLQKIEKLSSVSPNYLPQIKNFGIATKSSSLFVVTSRVVGLSWGKLDLDENVCLDVINQFIVAVEHLHEIGVTHGGLRPENVMVLHTDNETKITTIGIPEFILPNGERDNRVYSPEKVSDYTIEELDNYAVMHMSLELLSKSNHVSGIAYTALSKAIETEYADYSFSFKSLTRFKQSFEMKVIEKNTPVSIVLKGNFERLTIHPDNGKIYVNIDKSKENAAHVKVRLTGIGGYIFLVYSPKEQVFISGSDPHPQEFIDDWHIRSSQLDLGFPIEIKSGLQADFLTLKLKLHHNKQFQRAIDECITVISKVVPNNVSLKSEEVISHNEFVNLAGENEMKKTDLTAGPSLSVTSSIITEGKRFADVFEKGFGQVEIKKDSLVTGVVTAIDSEIVTIDVGSGYESEVSRSEYINSAGELEVAVGDEVPVNIQKIEDDLGPSQVSRQRAMEMERWHQLNRIYFNDETVTGVISGRAKGGFSVELGGICAFLPGSLIDTRPLQDVSHLEGVDLEFKILKLDMLRNNVVVSRRALMDQAAKAQRTQILPTLFEESKSAVEMRPSAVVMGTVLKIDGDWVTVHAGLKSNTIIPIEEIYNDSHEVELKIGDQVKVSLESVEDGTYETKLSREKAMQANVIGDQVVKRKDFEITTKKLWQAILETELETYPYIEIVDQPLPSTDGSGDLVIQYDSDTNPIGKFKKTDDVELVQKKGDRETVLGKVNLNKSFSNKVVITETGTDAEHLSERDVVYFRSKRERSISKRRINAIKKLLKGAGQIGNLVDYFDPTCALEPLKYDITVSDQDFSQYDNHDKKTSLNKHQRDAFIKLLQNGPLSLLQGPPGTGKTEFIAAFVHFLLSKQGVQKILLVSTTNEAVNNASERIRTHFARSGSDLSIVRFSSNPDNVSLGLKDVYSEFLVSEKRELFRAEVKYRLEGLATAYGVQPKYLEGIVDAELRIFNLVDQYCADIASISKAGPQSDDLLLTKQSSIELALSIREIVAIRFDIHLAPLEDVSDVKDKVINKLNKEYSIRPDECKRALALAKISSDMLGVLAANPLSYDEFFARSKQLITGTCVGIGKYKIGMQDNQYDWVIIDEAALASTSDLAIAMQSGKRILLVGDHKQLSAVFEKKQQNAMAEKLEISWSNAGLHNILECDFAKVFESPYGIQTSARLLTQYRMAPAIGRLVSENFYEGTLENGERTVPEFYSAGPQFLNSFVTWVDTSDLDEKSYHKNKTRSTSLYNICEADLIIKMLKEIHADQPLVSSLKDLVNEDEAAIGVICMYSDQVAHISKMFNEEVWSDEFESLVNIGTVDSYQGKENRIIILSVTLSSSSKQPKFLRIPNRINVALSRAMDRLVVVGSVAMWKGRNEALPFGKVVSFMSSADSKEQYRFISSDVIKGVKGVEA